MNKIATTQTLKKVSILLQNLALQSLRFFIFIICIFCFRNNASAQMPKWIVPPSMIDFNANGTIVPLTLLNSPPSSAASNAAFDKNSNLLFYAAQGNLYDASGAVFGSPYGLGSYAAQEISIVKVPDTCNKYYVIYCSPVPTAGYDLSYALVEVSSTNVCNMISYNNLGNVGFYQPGLAISKIKPNGTRSVYVVSTGQFIIFDILNNGIIPQQTFIFGGNIGHYSEAELTYTTNNIKIAFGTREQLATSNIVYEIVLDYNNNFNSLNTYVINGATGIYGVEYYDDGIIVSHDGTTKGITLIDTSGVVTTYANISGSSSYGTSMIEKANNDKFYVLNGASLAIINPVTQSIAAIAAMNINQFYGFYLLPDQVDNEDYIAAEYQGDLWMRDNPSDQGFEPNNTTAHFWQSSAIKINASNLGGPILQGHNLVAHQNPQYGSNNYVYVELSNRGCRPIGAGDEVIVYFSKASTGLNWPQHWINYSINSVLYGNEIGRVTLSNDLNPGDQITIKIPWNNVPNPSNFSTDPNHFCLLARIVSPIDDPMYIPEGISVFTNTKNNNNIVWRNVNVINQSSYNGGIVVRHTSPDPNLLTLGFSFGTTTTQEFLEFGTVTITPEPDLLAKWLQGGGAAGMDFDTNGTFTLINQTGYLQNMHFEPEEAYYLDVTFEMNFPFDPAVMDSIYLFDVIQYTGSDLEVVGGVSYEIEAFNLYNPPPEIGIHKTAIDGSDIQYVNPGGIANFEITIINEGQTNSGELLIDDPLSPNCNNTITSLTSGESFTYTCSSEPVYSNFTNTVFCYDQAGVLYASDDSEVILTQPAITIEIIASNGSDIQYVNPGGTAEFLVTINNVGNVELEHINVTDFLSPSCAMQIPVLWPGEAFSYICSFDNLFVSFVNEVFVTATPLGGGESVDAVDDTEVILTQPGIAIEVNAPDGSDTQYVNSGEAAEFAIIVINTGDVNLENVAISDPFGFDCTVDIGNLPIGNIFVHVCSSDLLEEDFIYTIDAYAQPVGGGDPVSASDDSQVILTPEPPCPDTLYLSGQIPSGLHISNTNITSNGTIDSGQVVAFSAGSDILLDSGFEAQSNTDFHARIEGCSASSDGLRTDGNSSKSHSTIARAKDKKFRIIFNNNIITKIEILDIDGDKVKHCQTENLTDIELDLSDFPEGIYLIRFTDINGKLIMNKIKI